jgi:hypothetical protein
MVAYSFKKRFVDPIKSGLGIYDPILGLQPKIVKPKRQTIRAIGKRRHARPGETLQLYTAMRTKQCAKIGDARCMSIEPIKLWISLKHIAVGKGLNPIDDDFARKDGFDDAKEMHTFWIAEHGAGWFEGVLIQWEPLT